MAWTDFTSEETLQYQRYVEFFAFFSDDESFIKSVSPGRVWRLEEVRLHFSVVFGSANYFTARLSATKGSAYNTVLISHAVLNSTDIFYHFSYPYLFMSDDVLVFSLLISVANVAGLEVHGWAVEA